MGFSRQEYWSRLSFSPPGDPLDSGIKSTSSALAGLTTEPPVKPRFSLRVSHLLPIPFLNHSLQNCPSEKWKDASLWFKSPLLTFCCTQEKYNCHIMNYKSFKIRLCLHLKIIVCHFPSCSLCCGLWFSLTLWNTFGSFLPKGFCTCCFSIWKNFPTNHHMTNSENAFPWPPHLKHMTIILSPAPNFFICFCQVSLTICILLFSYSSYD